MRYLLSEGYSVDWAHDGEEAMELSFINAYDLYLFDMNVPLLSGSDLLEGLRAAGDFTPTIIISAQVDVASVTKGFRAGADDYVKKPFDPDELHVRIQAKTAGLKSYIEFKAFRLDTQSEVLYYKGEQVVQGEVQNRILIKLLRHCPNPVPKESLLDLLERPTDAALRVHINKLKKRFELSIESVRGVGYKLT